MDRLSNDEARIRYAKHDLFVDGITFATGAVTAVWVLFVLGCF
jgi:hypothetical protein